MAPSIKDRKRLTKALPSTGVEVPELKIKKSDKAQRERWRRFREMEIFLDAQLGIYQCLLKGSAVGEISISEVLSALKTEPGESKILSYFKVLKGVRKLKYS